ncbi:histidine kinase [Streptococcus catagoni]|uniref:histidine kinase n=1 Tax=Streptococcus catagoni TaxID=2654874 RepID=UPI001F3DE942|nr:histidine kinase [Streptococcus catagoni]
MSLFVNGGMIWFFFYMNSILVYGFKDDFKSFRFVSYVLGFLFIILFVFIRTYSVDMQIMAVVGAIMNVSMIVFSSFDRQKAEAEEALYEKNKSINLLLAENERNRIAQDLHDTLGHVFVMFTVKADLIQALLDRKDIEQAQKEVGDLQDISKKCHA